MALGATAQIHPPSILSRNHFRRRHQRWCRPHRLLWLLRPRQSRAYAALFHRHAHQLENRRRSIFLLGLISIFCPRSIRHRAASVDLLSVAVRGCVSHAVAVFQSSVVSSLAAARRRVSMNQRASV